MVSNSLQPHGLPLARLPCSPLSPYICSNSCSLSWWCYRTNLFFAIPISFCLQSFPTSVSFPMSQLFKSGGQMIGASVLASVLSMNIQGWFPRALMGWISLQPKELSRVHKHHSSKASLCQCSPSLWSNSHIHTDNWKKNIALFTLSLYKFCWCLFHEVCELLF